MIVVLTIGLYPSAKGYKYLYKLISLGLSG